MSKWRAEGGGRTRGVRRAGGAGGRTNAKGARTSERERSENAVYNSSFRFVRHAENIARENSWEAETQGGVRQQLATRALKPTITDRRTRMASHFRLISYP